MDISSSNTEPYIVMHRFHERFNHSIKMAAIGLCLVEDALSRGVTRDEFMNITYATGALWGGMPSWTDPVGMLQEARSDLGDSGLLRAFSAFDRFLDGIDADLSAWRDFKSRDGGPVARQELSSVEGNDRALRFYERHQWSPDEIEFLDPVYRYYRATRDCIAHRSGIASRSLALASQRESWATAIEKWDNHTDDRTRPPLVELAEGDRIMLTHRDAILASSVLLRIARNINEHTLTDLGVDGVTYLAFRRTLTGNPPELRVVGFRTPIAVLHDALSGRYRVGDLAEQDTIAVLRSLGVWNRCRDEFERLQRTGYFPS